ncbi:MAG: hypothetical protein C4297_08775 [Gemmataceae bacterium]
MVWLPALRWALTALVLAGAGWALAEPLAEAMQKSHVWSLPWLTVAAGAYLVGVAFSAWYWHIVLRALGQRPRLWTLVRAYYIGHLGKYVPGKALVVVIRAALVRSEAVQVTPAVVAVFYETLTCMASGALLGLLVLLWLDSWPPVGGWVAVLVLAVLFPVIPGVFNAAVRWLTRPFAGPDCDSWARLHYGHLLVGLLLCAVSWVLWGGSAWAVLRGCSEQQLPIPAEWTLLCRCVAAVSLATVAGFVIPTPAGLGTREWVLMELLAPTVGQASAALTAVLVRVTWIVAEILVAGVLWLWPAKSHAAPPVPAGCGERAPAESQSAALSSMPSQESEP